MADIEMASALSTVRATVAGHIQKQTTIILNLAFIVTDFIIGDLIVDNIAAVHEYYIVSSGIKWSIKHNDNSVELLFREIHLNPTTGSDIVRSMKSEKNTFINKCINGVLHAEIFALATRVPYAWRESFEIKDCVKTQLKSSMLRLTRELST